MSNVSRIVDNRVPVATFCGNRLTGTYTSLVRSGVNSSDLNALTENPYSMQFLRTDSPVLRFRFKGGNGVWYTCVENLPAFYFPVLDGNDQINLINRLGEKVRGHSFNPLVTLGEGRESLKMVLDASSALYKGLRSFKRGDFRGAALSLGLDHKDLRGTLSSKWLGMQYGVKPLLHDIDEGARAFAAIYAKRRTSFKVGTSKKGNVYYPGHDVAGKVVVGRRIKLILSEDHSTFVAPSWTQFATVAWELTTLSFVADWVIPIGSYLSSLDHAARLQGLYVTSDYRYAIGRITDNPELEIEGLFPLQESVAVTRAISTMVSVPSPNFRSLRSVFTREDRESGEVVPFYKRVLDSLALFNNLTR